MSDRDDSVINRHDMALLEKAVCGRLDGHGEDLKQIWCEIKDMRKEQNQISKDQNSINTRLLEKIHDSEDKIATARELCQNRHSATSVKVVGTSSFISGVITAIGLYFHK